MTTTITITRAGQQYEVDVEGHVVSYGSPGRYYGPPERCYPAEAPEVEIESASLECCGFPVELNPAERSRAEGLIAAAEREAAAGAWAEARAEDRAEGWS